MTQSTGTALIVPAMTDQAGQCRIVYRDSRIADALSDYRAQPDAWREVGLMNSRGKLVCIEPIGNLRQELEDCSPLYAGLVVQVSQAQG